MRAIKKEDLVDIIVNGKVIGSERPNRVMAYIFRIFFSQIKYMSNDALKMLLTNTFSLIKELGPKGCARAILYGENILQGFDRARTIQYITNTILSAEGLGLLPGFGFAAFEYVEGKKKVTSRKALQTR